MIRTALLLSLLVMCVAGCDRTQTADAAVAAKATDERTEAYIATLDLAEIERRGCDYLSERYDPARLGIPLADIEPQDDYDFERLAEVEARLEGVDRRRVLAHLFEEVTKNATANQEKHRALLRFLHRASYDGPILRPVRPDGIKVWDPLIVLELNEMLCGSVARLAVDLWDAGGFEARCIDFGGHTSAEVFYDDDWHYFGADSCGGNGLVVLSPDGSIPSWVELSRTPGLIDALPHRFELRRNGAPRMNGTPVRSTNCFDDSKGEETRYFWKAEPAEPGDPHYGWTGRLGRLPADWNMHDGPPRFQPGPPLWRRVTVQPRSSSASRFIELEWDAARDQDHDVLGYRVFVSRQPRGWNYAAFKGSRRTRPYWSSDGGWDPAMYDAMYRLPPHEVARLETTETSVRLEVENGETYFVTVMAYDAYHESVGKTLYLMSSELRIDCDPEPVASEPGR